MKSRNLFITVIAGALAVPGLALAAGDSMDKPRNAMDESQNRMQKPAGYDPSRYSDRARMKQWSEGKGRLEKALRAGEGREFYRQELERLGYTITALNQDEPDYLEYEVVKGDNSYEIQVGFDGGSAKATEVDVAANVWKAKATEQALEVPGAEIRYPKTTTGRYSDRTRLERATNEKDQLERSLKVGQPKGYYPAELKRLGYRITAVNDNEPGYLEYEVVKGDESFEVQVDFDKGGKASEVDVTTNMWRAEETERALEKK